MSVKKVGLLTFIAMIFAMGFLSVILIQKSRLNATVTMPSTLLQPFHGKLAIVAIDDFRVSGYRILLCGVGFTRPQSMRELVTEAARREFQGLALTCNPVGTGTPCDGRIASKFGDKLVVQCFTSDGMDLAAKLVENGILCGQTAQAGSAYKPCVPGS